MAHIFKSIFKILNKTERLKFIKLIVFDVFIGFFDIAFLAVLIIIIDFYIKNTDSYRISFLHQKFANPNSLSLITVFLILFCLKNWVAFIGLKAQHHFFYAIATRLSKKNMMNFLNDSYQSFVNINSATQIRKISQQPVEFSQYILSNLQQLISQIILISFTICAIFLYHPTVFAFLFMVLLIPVVVIGWTIRKNIKRIRLNIKNSSEKALQFLQEGLMGYVESNIYLKKQFFVNRYATYQRQLNDNLAAQQGLQSLPSRLIEIFAILGFFLLIAINKLKVTSISIDLITIGVFMVAAYKIIPGIVKIINCIGQMKTYEFAIIDLLAEEDIPEEKNESLNNESISSINFSKLSFNYTDRSLLKNVEFSLATGDFVGIKGKSGEGKTTLINLLLGYLNQTSGKILINGRETDTLERQEFWNRISYVKQQPFLLEDSVLKNIVLSDGEYDASKLNAVISFCDMETMLLEYEERMEKIIKENGQNISGGQRQRVMLARALYHDFDLLILDEPFSELDNYSEQKILKSLQLLAKEGKMILFITHNEASLAYCNKIITINEN